MNTQQVQIIHLLTCCRFNVIIKKECGENIQLCEMTLETVPECVISGKLKLDAEVLYKRGMEETHREHRDNALGTSARSRISLSTLVPFSHEHTCYE